MKRVAVKSQDDLARRMRVAAASWLAFVSLIYMSTTLFMVSRLVENRKAAAVRHQARMDPTMLEVGRTRPETAAADMGMKPKARKVKAGIYVDNVSEFSTRDSKWAPEFYIWFEWSGDDIDPGKTFHIVDGKIVSRQLQSRHDEGDKHYALYRITAEITKHFSTDRFPRDDHLLTIRIEDTTHYNFDLEYIPDVEGSQLSSRASLVGYAPYSVQIIAKDHSYRTPRGDPRLPSHHKATYSQLVLGIGIKRSGWGLYVKMFTGTFTSVVIALLAFFVRPKDLDPRFGIGVGAFFACIAGTILVAGEIPLNNSFGLTEFVAGISTITIFLSLLTSTMSLAILRTLESDSWIRRFDMSAVSVFAVGWGASTIVVSIIASMGVWPTLVQQIDLVKQNPLFHQVVGMFFWVLIARTTIFALEKLVWQGWMQQRMAAPPPRILAQISNAVVWTVCAFLVFSVVFDKEITGLLTASGVVIAVVGFALRNLISDVFTGIVMGFEGHVRIGDWIEIEGEEPGMIQEISWRTTRFVTERGIDIIVPNSQLAAEQYRNFHRPDRYFRESFYVHLDYDITSHQASRILLSAISQIPESMAIPRRPSVRIHDYSQRGVEWEARFYVPDYSSRSFLRYQVQRNVLRNLHFSGIEIASERIESQDVHRADESRDSLSEDLDFLKAVEILSCLDHDELAGLLDGLGRSIAKAGEPVVEINDLGTSLFIVREGVLNVFIAAERDESIKVGQLVPGSFFGEMSLLTGEARSATVVPDVDSFLFEITKEQIEPILSRNPAVVERLSAVLADRQMANIRAMADSSIEDPDETRSGLAREFVDKIQRFFNIGTLRKHSERSTILKD